MSLDVRLITVGLPTRIYEKLLADAQAEDTTVEALAAELLGEAAHFGSPAKLSISLKLVTEVADLMISRRRQHRAALAEARADLLSLADVMRRIARTL